MTDRQTDRTSDVALSTDYLNIYNEALMLIEMAGEEPSAIEALREWRPVGYVAHFAGSRLRFAAGAIAAYEALDPTARRAFETLCGAMDRLVATVLQMMDEDEGRARAKPAVAVAARTFHSLLGRATAFINSGGDLAAAEYDAAEWQATIDAILAG